MASKRVLIVGGVAGTATRAFYPGRRSVGRQAARRIIFLSISSRRRHVGDNVPGYPANVPSAAKRAGRCQSGKSLPDAPQATEAPFLSYLRGGRMSLSKGS